MDSTTEKILVIQLSRLGDLIQTLPLLKRLKEEKTHSFISVVCIEEFSVLVRNASFVDKVISMTALELLNFKETITQKAELNPDSHVSLKEIWECKPWDLVINLTHDLVGSRLCALADAVKTVGRVWAPQGELRFQGDWAKYLVALSQNRLQNLFNLVDIYMGMGDVRHRPTGNYVNIPQGDEHRAEKILRDNGLRGCARLVAFQMGANKLHRAWPPESFAKLSEHLIRNGSVEIVLLGTEKETPLVRRFRQVTDVPVIDLVGKTTLTELAAVLQQCDILVSNDTGTVHMAVAVGTRVLGLYFSSAYYSETAPYGEGNVIVQVEYPCSPCQEREICEHMPCRDAITVDTIHEVTCAMLEGRRRFVHSNSPNVHIYTSTFLSNGTLLYEPVSTASRSGRYLTGFLNRAMWESLLGIEHDQSFADMLIWRGQEEDTLKATVADYIKGFSMAREQYMKGIASAQTIVAQFLAPAPQKNKIVEAANRLGDIEMEIAHIEMLPGLAKDFHRMEMMDTGETHYPGLAVQHAKKYRKLLGFSQESLAELNRISKRPPSLPSG